MLFCLTSSLCNVGVLVRLLPSLASSSQPCVQSYEELQQTAASHGAEQARYMEAQTSIDELSQRLQESGRSCSPPVLHNCQLPHSSATL